MRGFPARTSTRTRPTTSARRWRAPTSCTARFSTPTRAGTSWSRAPPPEPALPAAGMPALAPKLDLVARLLAVLATELAEGSALFDHAAAARVGARGRDSHDEPPHGNLTPGLSLAMDPFHIPVRRRSYGAHS